MIKKTLLLVLFAGLWTLTGCAGTLAPAKPYVAPSNAVTVLPYEIASTGLYRVQVTLNDQGQFNFIVDTGATISILFESTARQLSIPIDTGETTTVHGIIASSRQPVTNLNQIDIGSIRRNDLRVAILEDRTGDDTIDGIIGMDILRDYVLVFDKVGEVIVFHDPALFDATSVDNWRSLELNTNPYSDENFGIYFLNLKLSGYPVPAVFDLGSSLSIVNWTAAQNPSLRRYRRRLRENWEIEGAVGQFEPTVLVRFETVRSKAYTWEAWKIYITDMDTANIIGAADQALMIAGADMFRDTSFAVDFSTGRLWVKSTGLHKKERIRDRPMTGTRTNATTNAIGVFDGVDQ